MARSIDDLALLDSVITGDRSAIRPARPEKLRLGVPRQYFYDNLDQEIVPLVEKALATLRAAGCTLIEANIPDYEKLSAFSLPLLYYECVPDLARYLGDERLPLSAADVVVQIASPDARALYETYGLGPERPTREWYEHAVAVDRPALQDAYQAYFHDHNVAAIVLPTTVLPARPIGQDAEVELNGRKVSTLGIYARNTQPASAAGLPGLSIPVGMTAGGLPVGIEFDGSPGTDRKMLGIGFLVEQLFGKLPPPPL
jgi:mandelamide amidase